MSILCATLVRDIEKTAYNLRTTLVSHNINSLDNNAFPELIKLMSHVFSNLEYRTSLRVYRKKEKCHNAFEYSLITALNYLVDSNIQFTGFAKVGDHTRKVAYVSTDHIGECEYTEQNLSHNKFSHEISLQSENPLSIYCTYQDVKKFTKKDNFVDAARSGKLRFQDTPIPENSTTGKRRKFTEPELLDRVPDTQDYVHPNPELPQSDMGASLYVANNNNLSLNPDLFGFMVDDPTRHDEWHTNEDLSFLTEAAEPQLFSDDLNFSFREIHPAPDTPIAPPPPVVKPPTEEEMKLVSLHWLDQWMQGGTWASQGQFVFYAHGSRLWKYADDNEFELVTDVKLEDMDEMISRPDYFEEAQVRLVFSVSP